MSTRNLGASFITDHEDSKSWIPTLFAIIITFWREDSILVLCSQSVINVSTWYNRNLALSNIERARECSLFPRCNNFFGCSNPLICILDGLGVQPLR